LIINRNDLIKIPYKISILPGIKKDISGSLIVGKIIGIAKNIDETKKNAALEIVKLFTSKEYQRNKFENGIMLSAMNELCNCDEICNERVAKTCDFQKSIQFTSEPRFIKERGEGCRKKYQKYIYQFLYKNKTIEETLKHVIDITKIYYVSLDTVDSYAGLFCFIFFSVVSTLMLLSLIFIYKDNLHLYFKFLSNDFWIITVLGSVIILWVPLINYGRITTLKCHLKVLLMSVGYTFSIGPSFYKLIIQYPKENKISKWIKNHNKYIFLILNLFVDILMNSISLINPYTVKSILIEEGENFEICKYNSKYSIILLLLYKLSVILLMLYLIYVERNISSTLHNMKFIISVLYIDTLFIIIIFIYHIIEIKNYISNFLFQTLITSIISISNYLLLYISRQLLKYDTKEKVRIEETSNNHFKFIINSTQIESKTLNNYNSPFPK